MVTTTISLATPFSFRRTASSTAISQKGFIDILTLASSTPVWSALTRTLTLASTTRLTATNIFIKFTPCSQDTLQKISIFEDGVHPSLFNLSKRQNHLHLLLLLRVKRNNMV